MRNAPRYLVWAAVLYVAVVCLPVARKWWAARMAIQEIAGMKLTVQNRYQEIGKVLDALERDSGVVLYRGDVRYIRDSAEGARVEAEVEVPVRFPLTGYATSHRFVMSAKAPDMGGR